MSGIFIDGDEGSYAELLVAPELIGGYILHTIYVPPAARGKGHGADLLQRVLTSVPEDLPITLAAVPDKDCPIDVIAWYERHGFTHTRSGVMMERSAQRARQERAYG